MPYPLTFCREWLFMALSVYHGDLWFSRALAMAPLRTSNLSSLGDLLLIQAPDVASLKLASIIDLQWSSFKTGLRRYSKVVVPLRDFTELDLHRSWLFLFLFLFFAYLPLSSAGGSSEVNEEIAGQNDLEHCEGLLMKKTVINYAALHACVFHHSLAFSVPFLLFMVVLAFYILATAAQSHFSPVVARMAEMLHLSPSTGGVTLLALGNGAPDVFASIAAVWGGNPRIGLGAIVSAGLFVTAFVVGFVALAASPFPLKPTTFLRDVCFYILAVTLMFLVYLSGEVYAWQAMGLVSLYFFFVAVVFSMDRDRGKDRVLKQSISDLDVTGVDDHAKDTCIDVKCHSKALGHIHDNGRSHSDYEWHDLNCDSQGMVVEDGRCQPNACASDIVSASKARQRRSPSAVLGMLVCTLLSCGDLDSIRCKLKLQLVWQLPVEVILRSTIPAVDASKWNRCYAALNLACCPLIILYIISAAVSPYRRLVFIIPGINLPLWTLVLMQGSVLGLAYYVFTKEPPKSDLPITVVTAFVMSVFWISFVAGELLGCLATLGKLLKLPPALLGLTVLAWGNSVGDLVADVAVARAGQPAMAMAGCFAGPMFNMLVGFGLALAMKASRLHPAPYPLEYNPSIVIAFGFLFVSLLGSLLVVSWSKFQVPRFWGFCLIALYITFVIVSISNANLL
ncbi:hypothetical protein GOP47_0014236 [Adiantum capillus-veneris]|uniref:Sodium/calcium exchanger membrane region domain-containing protein n=1 Tax=Adiantum capillus-veneris TaxID=13818 RepID=A0A9D4ZBX7_ADICA|nr:hypothetical protein GOP47_0014236 [Adiantum capillus-veneris]